jgi:putative phosphoesterase
VTSSNWDDEELTVQIAVISDTHMPRGARRLPEPCVERLRAADLILHAGDLLAVSVLHDLESYGRVIAVRGNVDDAGLREALPETASVTADGARIAMVHDAGPAKGRLSRLRRRFPEADAVVFGHSHIPLHERADNGFQIFNPGSPTERRRSPQHTMGMATVRDGQVRFELVVVG